MRIMSFRDVTEGRALWLAALIAVSAALTILYACITPFAAFALIAATTLSRRGALACAGAVWLASQAVGFGALGYPWTVSTVAWGLALGGAAVLATLAAQWTVQRLRSFRTPIPMVAAFLAAFGAHQATLYLVAASMLGGTGAFAPSIVGQVLLVNTVALVGFIGLHHLAAGAGWLLRRLHAHLSPARSA